MQVQKMGGYGLEVRCQGKAGVTATFMPWQPHTWPREHEERQEIARSGFARLPSLLILLGNEDHVPAQRAH